MKAKNSMVACATSQVEVDWHSIDWNKVNRNVRRLQARIVKATQEGRWGKVKALQRLLTHSFSGKAMAVRRVTENQGKNTPGVDGETWDTPQKKAQAIPMLKQRGYRPQPLRRVYIPKKNGKMRPLGIPTMKDRAMQALYLLALDPIAETQADRNSYGFRPKRSTADAIGQCFIALGKKASPQWILEGDIKACFDKISHEWLLANIPMDKAVLQKWLKAGFMEKDVLHPTEEGTPQGGIISPTLANMALDGLETTLWKHWPQRRVGGAFPKVNFVRYADDFIVTGATRELLEMEVLPLIGSFLAERGLTLSKEKTKITHIEDGFDFLGQNVRKYNGVLIIKPAKNNVQAFLRKVREVIKSNKTATAGNLIGQLNPIIRGWANYHRHVCSKSTFGDIDNAIFKALWQWAVRRHPHKGKRWVKAKYFRRFRKRTWVFTGEGTSRNGEEKLLHLLYAKETPIRRHIKVRAEANPYDPQWEEYFEHRLHVQMENDLEGYRKLLNLWKSQDGRCPVCQEKITKTRGWHLHHIVWRSQGGGDEVSNLVLLHPNCHRKVHSRRLTVVKPCPAKGITKA